MEIPYLYKKEQKQHKMEEFMPIVNSDETAEYAYILKSICDTYGLFPNDICQLHLFIDMWFYKDKNRIRHKKRVPVKMKIPDYMAAKDNKIGLIDITSYPTPTLDDPREFGVYEWEMLNDERNVRFWRCRTWRDYGPMGRDFIIVEKQNIRLFYKIYLKYQREFCRILTPIMDNSELIDIYENTIGFLENGERNKKLYHEYNIPCKRGILLAGSPGCGKTNICKWLRQLCIDRRWPYKIVTLEDYRRAASQGDIYRLFKVGGPKGGIIFFDDMDILFQDRKTGNQHLQIFLTELDGIETTEGIVFIFTSNRIGDELDKAFVRPGRIDLFKLFKPPNEKLRKRFVEERFHPDVLKEIDIDEIVKLTDKSISDDEEREYSFAELEEIRKLITLEFIKTGKTNVEKSFKLFEQHRKDFREQYQMGFARFQEDEDISGDESEVIALPWEAPRRFR